MFGGTWTQIKDRFILAAGDSYTNGVTGGAATVTLSVNNMPSHTHTFTPSGDVSSHSHGLNSHTHTFTPSGDVSSHSHGLNSHTHTFTPSGNVSSHSHTLNSGNTSVSGTKTTAGFRSEYHKHEGLCGGYNIGYDDSTGNYNALYAVTTESSDKYSGYMKTTAVHVTGYLYGSTDSSKPTFTGTAGTTGAASGNTASSKPTFTGTAGTTGAASGNTASSKPTFTGVQGNTDSSGSGTLFSIMPPYVVKYCWERTA